MYNNHLKRLLQTLRFILDSLEDSNPVLDAARIAIWHYIQALHQDQLQDSALDDGLKPIQLLPLHLQYKTNRLKG